MIKIIRKKLNFTPNMVDYARTYRSHTLAKAKKEIEFFPGGKINAAYNAVDRHLKGPAKNKVALYWEGEEGQTKKFTFQELSILSNKFANVLKKHGIDRGDRVFLFLSRPPELYISFLGIVKTGAIAGTMFAAFGEQAIVDRLENSGASIVITDSELKKRIDKVRRKLPKLKKIILIDAPKTKGNVISFWQEMEKASSDFHVARMSPEDPAFMLYTSGTTGRPKGVIHAHRAIIHEHISAKYALDIQESDVYWCTADPGWVTGIAYGILGSWSNKASSLVYNGRFSPAKWYEIVERYRVNIWYTAPTAVRMLAANGVDLVKKYDMSSLRYMASVGEPLNPEAVVWGLKAFGLPIHDNYWQTETGGIVIANYPCMAIKPGSMGRPMPGVHAAIIDKKGRQLGPGNQGRLVLEPGWPSMMKTIWRRPNKYKSYFTSQGGKKWYITGDVAYKDKDGYFWFIGRDDDVIKTSGERVGPFEVESALCEHPAVIEAGVIGKPDALRGEIVKAFVTLKQGTKSSKKLVEDLQKFVKRRLAGHAYPREIEFVSHLPKTRSGKIMRRYLKAKELGLPVGDTSTLEKF